MSSNSNVIPAWNKNQDYYPPKIWATAVYGGWWDFFIVESYILWGGVFLTSLYKLYSLHGLNFNKYFNYNLGNVMLLVTTITSLFRLIYFIDPKGFNGILNAFENGVFLRIPQLTLLSGFFLLTLFWRQLERGTFSSVKVTYGVYFIVFFLLVIIIPLTLVGSAGILSTAMDDINNAVFIISVIILFTSAIVYSRKLTKVLNVMKTSNSAVFIAQIRSLTLHAITAGSLLIILLLWDEVMPGVLAPWDQYVYYFFAHNIEAYGAIVLVVAVRQGAKRGQAKSTSANASQGSFRKSGSSRNIMEDKNKDLNGSFEGNLRKDSQQNGSALDTEMVVIVPPKNVIVEPVPPV